jgi:signal transduction histidine kinase
MLRDTNRLQNLINSILEISALESKKQRENFTIKSAKDFLPKIIKTSADNFRLTDDVISISVEGDSNILIDEHSFKMVFDNLIDNSIKYNTGNLKIRVKITCKENKVEIEFKDNGIGIEPKEQKNIFKKFYRIYDSDIPNVKGTGLGLYWIKGIIKNHNGKISVYSEGKGKGTTFKIILPSYKSKK